MKNIAFILILFSLVACKKEPTAPAEPTPEELISRTWQVQSVQVNGQGEDAADYSNFRFTFNADQTYRFLNPDEQQGSWQLTANGTLLILNQGTEQEQQVPIFELSETELLLEFTEESEKLGITRTRFGLAP
ncbi:MAG: lipocalin family protein [Bacteroidota bacterium]